MYEHLVSQALDQLDQGNPLAFTTIANQLATPQVINDDSKLSAILRALSRETGRIDGGNATAIIQSVLALPWSNRSTECVDSYVRFLAVLISSIPRWWIDVAHKIVEEFVLPIEQTVPHHTVLRHIVQIIPTAVPKLSSVLVKHFPHKHERTGPSLNYVKNLLKHLEYCPEQQRAVWGLLIEKVMQLDVETENDDEDEDDEDEDEDEETEDEESDDEDSEDDSSEPPSKRMKLDFADGEEVTAAELEQVQSEALLQLQTKLDAILSELLIYLDGKFSAQEVENGNATPLFIILLEKFKEYVLPTHTTRSVQYIMFKVSHAHPDLLDSFLVSMVEMALSPAVPIDRRQKAMQYISSFVSRARGLSRTQIVFVVSFLAGWVEKYATERESEVDEASNMARFRVFYAAVQALFYTFCFRHSMLRKPDSAGEWEADLDKLFQRVIMTKFNPLKYCKSTVVAMFARIARNENVAYCFSIMEQNRIGRFRAAGSTSPPSSASSSSLLASRSGSLTNLSKTLWPNHREFAILESYFPFDPMSLPNSRKLVQNIYIEWGDVNDAADSDSASASESEDDSESDSNVDDDELDVDDN